MYSVYLDGLMLCGFTIHRRTICCANKHRSCGRLKITVHYCVQPLHSAENNTYIIDTRRKCVYL